METQAGFLITQIKQIGGRVFDKILQKKNIKEFNGAREKILYILWQHDHISIIELSRLTGLANTTLTSMLDRMEKAELLHRLSDPKDRRKIKIAPISTTCSTYFSYTGEVPGAWGEPGKMFLKNSC